MRYSQSSIDYGWFDRRANCMSLAGFINRDWTRSQNDVKSTSGSVHLDLVFCVCAARSKAQSSTVNSWAEDSASFSHC